MTGKKAAIIIMTDGEASDGSIAGEHSKNITTHTVEKNISPIIPQIFNDACHTYLHTLNLVLLLIISPLTRLPLPIFQYTSTHLIPLPVIYYHIILVSSHPPPLHRFLPFSFSHLHCLDFSLNVVFYFLLLMCSTETMRQLEKLPVWVVVRLCTDEDKMVNYWNNVDSEVELNMDVIDDHLGEAREIYK